MRFPSKPVLAVASLCICAQAETAINSGIPATQIAIDAKEADDFQRFALVPVLGYTEETRFEFGAMANIFFRPSHKGGRTSELDIIAYGTTEDQYSVSISPLVFLFNDRVSGNVYFYYEDWSTNYYGYGNDPDINDYRTMKRSTFYTDGYIETSFLLPACMHAFKYGLTYEVNYSSFEFDEYDGDIPHPGDMDGWRNGIGYQLNYDTRDNLNWARHGFVAQWKQKFYPEAISDFAFSLQQLDIRGYSEFIWNTSMAVGFLWTRVDGDAPYDKLAGPDGIKRFRGVKTNYFNGKQSIFLQTEFRKELFWRLAGNIFFEGGKVGDYFSDLMRNKWHTGLGFGGQLALNKSEKLYARADFSWLDFKKDLKHIGLTFYIREAF